MRPNITDKELSDFVKKSVSWAGLIKKCGGVIGGGSYQHYQRRVKKLKIDTSHFLGQRAFTGFRNTSKGRRFHWSEVLKKRKSEDREYSRRLRRCYSDYCKENKIPSRCVECGNTGEWLGKTLKLEINHINECRWDNRPENLEWNCPNCHSTKTTYNPTQTNLVKVHA